MKRNYLKIKDFPNRKVRKKSILIVEPNPYHGEILPGFTYLFQKIGYRVDILAREEQEKENSFSRYPSKKMPKIYLGKPGEIIQELSSRIIEEYDIVFFSTNVWWEGVEHYQGYENYLPSLPKSKYGSMFIEHNLVCLDEDGARKHYEEGRVFTLLSYPFENTKTKLINPHYFGRVSIKSRINDRKSILIIGSSSKDEKNLKMLFKVIEELSTQQIPMPLFSFAGGKIDVPDKIKKHVNSLGRLDYETLYRTTEDYDFLMTLVDLDSEDIIHTKYSHGTTTGTVQLSLGFCKPMIIDRLHAQSYGFSENEAIIYDDLLTGLLDVMQTSQSDYGSYVNHLKSKARLIEDESIRNIKQSIKKYTKNKPGSRLRYLAHKVKSRLFHG